MKQVNSSKVSGQLLQRNSAVGLSSVRTSVGHPRNPLCTYPVYTVIF